MFIHMLMNVSWISAYAQLNWDHFHWCIIMIKTICIYCEDIHEALHTEMYPNIIS